MATGKLLRAARKFGRWAVSSGAVAAPCGVVNFDMRPAHAVPAAPIVRTLKQANGTSFKARQRGDEWFHWMETLDGRPIALNTRTRTWYYTAPARSGLGTVTRTPVGQRASVAPYRPGAPSSARAKRASAHKRVVPPIGTGFVPVILVNFSDRSTQFNAQAFDDLLFGSGNSMKNAYSEMSGGKFTVSAGPQGTVVGWYTASQTHAFYGGNGSGGGGNDAAAGQLVKEAVTAADGAGFNFAPYDQDGNGYVDVVNIIHQGTGEEVGLNANDIWSHRWSLNAAKYFGDNGAGEYQTNDNVKVDDYIIQPELLNATTKMTVGVFAHEYGHAMGLPDLYDIDYSSNGVGVWSLMAGGSWGGNNGDTPSHMDAWCKTKLGWITPTVPTQNILGAPIPNAEGNSFTYKLWKNGVPGSEYFLVENRQKTGFDSSLPASGLVIYHIDDSVGNNSKEWYPGNTTNGHYLVRVVQADGLWGLEKGQSGGDAGDVYITGRKLDETGAVNSFSYAGSSTFVGVKNVSSLAGTMTADIFVSPAQPALTIATFPQQFSENDGLAASIGVVTRNTLSSQPLLVTLSSDTPTAANVLTTVTIPANQASISFDIAAVNDNIATGTRVVALSASSPGFASASKLVSVLDDDVAALSISIVPAPAIISETAGVAAALATVTRNTPTTFDLRVDLESSDTTEATVQPSVTIPAGSTSISFPIAAIDDPLADDLQTVTLSATAAGMSPGSATLTVTDDEVAALTLAIAPSEFSESGGATAATGTVTRNSPTDVELAVTLSSTNTSAVTVPAGTTIPIGSATVSFPITAVNDVWLDGFQAATITAAATNFVPAASVVTVADDDVPALSLLLVQSTLNEGALVPVTVSLNLIAPTDVTVALSNSHPDVLKAPSSVVIRAGTSTTTFNVEVPDDANANGNQAISLGATAAGFAAATGTFSVSDNDSPQLTLTTSQPSMSEKGGVLTITASHNLRPQEPVVLSLTGNDVTEATMPPTIVIPAGSSSATFTVAAVDDQILDGAQAVTITANLGALTAAASFLVTDNEVPSLSLTIAPSRLTERGAGARATVTRNTPAASPLVVQLTSSNASALVMPARVTIPVGRASVSFSVTALDNALVDGTRLVTVRAAAGGLKPAASVVQLLDNDLPTLTLTVLPATFNEGGGLRAARAKVTRNSPTRAALTVSPLSNNANAARVPARVVIPAGKQSVEFFLSAVENTIADGSHPATITVRAAAHREAFVKATVADNDVAALTLTLSANRVNEKGGRITGTLSHNGSTKKAVIVQMVSSNSGAAGVPARVTIAAGRSAASFEIRGVDNLVADGSQQVSIEASASGFRAASGGFTALDDETPALTLTIQPGEIREDGGRRVASATLTRNTPVASLLTVALRSSNPSKVEVPGSVTFRPGASRVTFDLDAIDNLSADGTQNVTITASQAGLTPGTSTLTVLDNDAAASGRGLSGIEAVSPVTLSTATFSAASSTITLRFTGALDADTATNGALFAVTVGGKIMEVEMAMWNARTQSVLLQLPEGSIQSGAKVLVAWSELRDARGVRLRATTQELNAR